MSSKRGLLPDVQLHRHYCKMWGHVRLRQYLSHWAQTRMHIQDCCMHCARHSSAAAWLFIKQRRGETTPAQHMSVWRGPKHVFLAHTVAAQCFPQQL